MEEQAAASDSTRQLCGEPVLQGMVSTLPMAEVRSWEAHVSEVAAVFQFSLAVEKCWLRLRAASFPKSFHSKRRRRMITCKMRRRAFAEAGKMVQGLGTCQYCPVT